MHPLRSVRSITTTHAIETAPGRWVFVGHVPASLSLVMKDGSPVSAELAADIASFGLGLFPNVRHVSFTSEADALAALAAYHEAAR